MTAEISLMNRRALVLAGDSVVTVTTSSSDSKVAQTGEKIFELSYKTPMGLMIYNNLDFMGVPLDVIIREFRLKTNDYHFNNPKEACESFLSYLKEINEAKQNEDLYFFDTLRDKSRLLSSQIEKSKEQYLEYYSSGGKEDYITWSQKEAVKIINKEIGIYLICYKKGFLKDTSLDIFIKKYETAIDACFQQLFTEENSEFKSLFNEYAYHFTRSFFRSQKLTGLVFAGYGKNDIFPSLYSIEIDGLYFGEIKCFEMKDEKINAFDNAVQLIPFAQQEMVDRFLYGIDTQMYHEILFNLSENDKIPLKEKMDLMRLKNRNEVTDMVSMMGKQDLAYTAESLVNMTAIKRKISTQQETVGGPIDVAVITKNEGFIWVKRKHYFNQDLNVNFSERSKQRRES